MAIFNCYVSSPEGKAGIFDGKIQVFTASQACQAMFDQAATEQVHETNSETSTYGATEDASSWDRNVGRWGAEEVFINELTGYLVANYPRIVSGL